MSVGSSLLKDAREWIDARLEEIRKVGLLTEVSFAPRDREKQAIQWVLESSERIGEIILWDTGEAELSFASIETGEVRPEHRDIDGAAALEEALSAVFNWVSIAA